MSEQELDLREAIDEGDLKAISAHLELLAPHEIAEEITRLDTVESTLVWRLLQKDVALEVFEELDAENQQQLLSGMREQAFRDLLERMDPDDRARLLNEAPASFVKKVLAGLSPKERKMTAELLGYPEETVGRYMSPEVIVINESTPVLEVLETIRRNGKAAETVSVLAVVDKGKKFVGSVDLTDLVMADESLTVGEITDPDAATALVTDDAEDRGLGCWRSVCNWKFLRCLQHLRFKRCQSAGKNLRGLCPNRLGNHLGGGPDFVCFCVQTRRS